VIGAASDGSANSRVWSVGQGTYAQLGNGKNPESQAFRVDATNLTQVAKVDAGFRHTLALDTSGRLWAWGQNLEGEIGDGTTTERTTPVLTTLNGVIAISAGYATSYAIRRTSG
jgi:alpha-tubulin suppressor-like RCC1 family protein